MKELSIKEKAKAYDEALKVLHKYDGANIMFSQSLKEEMFPELKESEDERIRKEIIEFVKNSCFVRTKDSKHNREQMLAWLEKQGEHANFRNKIQIGDKVTRNEDGVLVNLSQLKRVAKKDEKQGEYHFSHDDEVILNQLIGFFTTGKGLQNTYDTIVEWLNDVRKRLSKQGEQKPTDKVEPKFKIGDV